MKDVKTLEHTDTKIKKIEKSMEEIDDNRPMEDFFITKDRLLRVINIYRYATQSGS